MLSLTGLYNVDREKDTNTLPRADFCTQRSSRTMPSESPSDDSPISDVYNDGINDLQPRTQSTHSSGETGNALTLSGSQLPVVPESDVMHSSPMRLAVPLTELQVTEISGNRLVPNLSRSVSAEQRRARHHARAIALGRPAPKAPAAPPRLRRDNDEQNTSPKPGKGLWHSSWRHKLILVCLFLGDMIAFMGFSLMAPFFPTEAADRGVSSCTAGWIFSVFPLVQFLTSPIVGKIIPKCGAKFIFIMGSFVCGTATIIFGFMDDIPTEDLTMYMAFCFLTRIIMALGASCWATASFTIATHTFTDNASTVMAILETASGVGQMIGPALGGALYEHGGFRLPFIVLGVLTLALLPLFLCSLERTKDSGGASSDSGLVSLLRVPAIAVVSLSVMLAGMLWISLDPILEPHLKEYNLSSSQIGFIFLLLSLCYSICSPLIGYMADRMNDSNALIVIGYFILFVAFLLIGPAPLLNVPRLESPWFTLGGVVVMGIGMSFAVIPTYDKIIGSAEKTGLEDNIALHGAVAGLWNAAYALGETVGPVAAGWMKETTGFEQTNAIFALVAFATAILLMGLWIAENPHLCKREETQEDLLQLVIDSSERDSSV